MELTREEFENICEIFEDSEIKSIDIVETEDGKAAIYKQESRSHGIIVDKEVVITGKCYVNSANGVPICNHCGKIFKIIDE